MCCGYTPLCLSFTKSRTSLINLFCYTQLIANVQHKAKEAQLIVGFVQLDMFDGYFGFWQISGFLLGLHLARFFQGLEMPNKMMRRR